MEAHLNFDTVGRFLNRFEEADENFDYLTGLRELFDSMDLMSGGLAHSRDSGSQSVLWNAADARIVQCSKELTRKRQHPTIKIARSRHYPFALSDFASEYSKNSRASQLIQNFKQVGLEEAYAVPIHTLGDNLYIFVLGKKGTSLNTEALLTIQAACQGVVGKMMNVFEARPRGHLLGAGRGQASSQMVATQGIQSAAGRHFHASTRHEMIQGPNLHSIAESVSMTNLPSYNPSSEVTDLLDSLDVLWGRYDAAIEAGNADRISVLSNKILDLTRRIDELEGWPSTDHLNDNAIIQ